MMREVEYIIVGDGYAGLFFAHQLIKNGKSFALFSEGKQSASQISAGVCNPVILRYYTKIWNTELLMDNLYSVFKEIKTYLEKDYLSENGVVRIFNNEHEKHEWLHKSHRDSLVDYLDPTIIHLKNIQNPFGAAHVKGTTRLHVKPFFEDYFSFLSKTNHLISERFDYQLLDIKNKIYQANLKFDKIVFAEGVKVKANPYFSDIPVIPNKGHRLTVRLKNELDDYVIKTKHFLFHLQNDEYFYGATYDRDSHDLEIEPDRVDELLADLKLFYKEEISVEEVLTAFRATTFDRRPIIGPHRTIPFLYLLNGLGARGVLNGTFFSKMLFENIEFGTPIFKEASIEEVYNGCRETIEQNILH